MTRRPSPDRRPVSRSHAGRGNEGIATFERSRLTTPRRPAGARRGGMWATSGSRGAEAGAGAAEGVHARADEEVEADLDLAGGQAERRAEADRARAAGQQQQAAVEGLEDDPVADVRVRGRSASRSPCRPSGPCRGRRRCRDGRLASDRSPAISCSPRPAALRGVLATSIRSSVARAAAQATGLPPKVLAWLPGGPVHDRLGGDDRPQRQAVGQPLGQADDVAVDAPVLARRRCGRSGRCRPGSRRSPAGCRARRRAPQAGEEAVGGDDVAALALDRLDEDGGRLLGRAGRCGTARGRCRGRRSGRAGPRGRAGRTPCAGAAWRPSGSSPRRSGRGRRRGRRSPGVASCGSGPASGPPRSPRPRCWRRRRASAPGPGRSSASRSASRIWGR